MYIKSANFLISQEKYMLWVLKRTVSLRRSFEYPQHTLMLSRKGDKWEIRLLICRDDLLRISTWQVKYHRKRFYLHQMKTCRQFVTNVGLKQACADPEGGGGGGGQGVQTPPWKITKRLGSLAILVRISLKSQSYKSSIPCWAILGLSAKRHLNGVSLTGHW